MRSFVVDGNFTADHIKQARPDDDVWLTNGEGMMTEIVPYNAHLKAAKDLKEVCLFLQTRLLLNYNFYRLEKPLRTIRKQLSGGPGCKLRVASQRHQRLGDTCLRTPWYLLSIELRQFFEG
jgi:hypothetical protein